MYASILWTGSLYTIFEKKVIIMMIEDVYQYRVETSHFQEDNLMLESKKLILLQLHNSFLFSAS